MKTNHKASCDSLGSDANECSASNEAVHLGSFCAMPFQHFCIGLEGTATICCMARDPVSESGRPMSLYKSSYLDIWNSKYMQEIRRKIICGEPVPQCQVCYDHEAATSTSYRTLTGLSPIPNQPLDFQKLKQTLAESSNQLDELPAFLKLELGNLCNLKCRMCCAAYSSEIERDPVHTQWAGGWGQESLHTIWEGDEARIGPAAKIGTVSHGIHHEQKFAGESVFWTNGAASTEVTLGENDRLRGLCIRMSEKLAFERTCSILIDGEIFFAGSVTQDSAIISIEFKSPPPTKFKIEMLSETIFNSQSELNEGLPLTEITLFRNPTAGPRQKKEVLANRLKTSGLWYNNDALLFDEVLGNAESLQRLYVTGGEPLLERRFAEIVDHLIENNFSKNISLEITTNGTVFSDVMFEKFKKFGAINVMLSIDGVGKTQEYIRYPSKWEVIEKNIRRMVQLGLKPVFVPTIQAYNMLYIADVGRFAHEVGADLCLTNLLHTPDYLASSVMPGTVQKSAAARLKGFLSDTPFQLSEALEAQVASLAAHFETNSEASEHPSLQIFNIFTNDLDMSRNQNLRESLPELYECIAQSGYQWSAEIAFSNRKRHRGAARDRVHAWI